MTMITPSYLGETIEYSSLHACRSTLEDPTRFVRQALRIASTRTIALSGSSPDFAICASSANFVAIGRVNKTTRGQNGYATLLRAPFKKNNIVTGLVPCEPELDRLGRMLGP